MGWLTVGAVALVQSAGAIALIWRLRRRWWAYGAAVILTALLLKPLEAVTGDVSRYLPPRAFSEGADGKDQIVMASAASTLLLPLLIAAALVCAIGWLVRSKAIRRH